MKLVEVAIFTTFTITASIVEITAFELKFIAGGTLALIINIGTRYADKNGVKPRIIDVFNSLIATVAVAMACYEVSLSKYVPALVAFSFTFGFCLNAIGVVRTLQNLFPKLIEKYIHNKLKL